MRPILCSGVSRPVPIGRCSASRAITWWHCGSSASHSSPTAPAVPARIRFAHPRRSLKSDRRNRRVRRGTAEFGSCHRRPARSRNGSGPRASSSPSAIAAARPAWRARPVEALGGGERRGDRRWHREGVAAHEQPRARLPGRQAVRAKGWRSRRPPVRESIRSRPRERGDRAGRRRSRRRRGSG